jgi:hypothetical protein
VDGQGQSAEGGDHQHLSTEILQSNVALRSQTLLCSWTEQNTGCGQAAAIPLTLLACPAAIVQQFSDSCLELP